MADGVPSVSECPLRDAETGVCTCLLTQCGDITKDSLNACIGVRCAYSYGCEVTETKYLDIIKNASGKIHAMLDEIENRK